ncbi:MAG TPA: bifunctional UDP-N-acetylglucosamine diphosphorylase/glucosamine-1-phosphate N-acetyltransferase GlmU, partial [Vicinamibacteria bacterium]
GVEPITVVVGHQADAVEAAFRGRGLDFVRQEPPLGTGHAVQAARERLAAHPTRTVLVINGDVPLLRGDTLAALLDAHRAGGAAATLLSVVLDDPAEYGRVVREPDGSVRAIVENKDASAQEKRIREINAGIYAFEARPLLEALARLRPQNAQGEYYVTDVVGLLRKAGHRVDAMAAADRAEALGVNSHAELAAAARILRRRRCDALMAAGVGIEDPETTIVGPEVEIAADALLRPFTVLEGRTRVAAEAVLGPFVRVVDSEIGPGAQILDHCLLRECVVEEGASVGPFAHVRPESRIGVRARVGNFVELKKSHLGAGAKASHLSYIGDATVGPGANIGAGTITCNYDGVDKHPTQIGAGAFVGSDTTLVAPLTVGEGAYIAAGSAITEDVPPGALALGRARQVIKMGWAEARRRKAGAGKGRHGEGG